MAKKPLTRAAARQSILDGLGSLDDEAFSWLVLALRTSAMTHGAGLQVWPDGLGGFQQRERLEQIRLAADAYLKAEK